MSEVKRFSQVQTASTIGDNETLLLIDAQGNVKRVSLSSLLSSVSGRNLILNSATPRSGQYGIGGSFSLSTPLQRGKKYTISVFGVKRGEGKTSLQLWNWGGMANLVHLNKISSNSTGDTYSGTFTVSSSSDELRLSKVELIDFPSSVTNATSFECIKLEEGNVGTMWTPAPEDIATKNGGGKTLSLNNLCNLTERRVA